MGYVDKNNIKEDLRTKILQEEYSPGDFLIERDLCELYGVSRTPMREVLFSLVNTGLVVKDKGKGFSVRALDLKLLFEVFEARESIEGMAARLCAHRLSSTGKVKLLELKRKLEDDSSVIHYSEAIALGRELHTLIISTTGNSLFLEFNEKLNNLAWLISTATRKVDTIEPKSREEHLNIINAILEGDDVLSEQYMREHIQNTFQSLIQATTPKYKLNIPLI